MSLAERIEIFAGIAHLGEDFVGVFEQMMPRQGERHVAPEAVEQPARQILFKRFDGMADRGLREVKLTGGKRETAEPRQGGKGE